MTVREELGAEDYDRFAKALRAEWRHQRSCLLVARIDLTAVRDLRFSSFPDSYIESEDW